MRPFHVILDLTSRCNLKCVMCYFAGTDRLNFLPFDTGPADGNMPVEVFEKIASELFPKARRVALGCAAEPMIHPRFREILAIAGRYGVPDLWFPTNLLALTDATAGVIRDAGVRTVAASIDGVTKETYEKIRVPAKWEQLLSRLEILRRARRSGAPRLRIIFTWMRSNRGELVKLPEFAEKWGAAEIDVRFVSPTVGVDVSGELLNGEDPGSLNAELASAARDAVARGLRLTSYPDFETGQDMPKTLAGRLARRLWRIRAGIDRVDLLRYALRKRIHGCAYPDRDFVIRPNGAVSPCIYWEKEPLGIYPADGLAAIRAGAPLQRIRDGLHSGQPIGTCASCGERREALYKLRETRGVIPPSRA